MSNPKSKIQNPKSPRAFTLMELLIVMLIITVLAALALAALQGTVEQARQQRTKAIIAKLDQLIMDRYDGYRTRTLPIKIPPNMGPPVGQPTTPRAAAVYRLAALHEIMRMELPDRRTDIIDTSTGLAEGVVTLGMVQCALQRSYYRKINSATGGTPTNWTDQWQGSECLYLIVSCMQDGDKNALDFFLPSEIGDTDADGMPEILDAWGRPIEFLRWAPGYTIEQPGADLKWGVAGTDDNGDSSTDEFAEYKWTGSDDWTLTTTLQSRIIPDEFDPVRVGGGFSLRPLIYSAGRNKAYDMAVDDATPVRYTLSINNPYIVLSSGLQIGAPGDADGDGYESWQDNITNHYQDPN